MEEEETRIYCKLCFKYFRIDNSSEYTYCEMLNILGATAPGTVAKRATAVAVIFIVQGGLWLYEFSVYCGDWEGEMSVVSVFARCGEGVLSRE